MPRERGGGQTDTQTNRQTDSMTNIDQERTKDRHKERARLVKGHTTQNRLSTTALRKLISRVSQTVVFATKHGPRRRGKTRASYVIVNVTASATIAALGHVH